MELLNLVILTILYCALISLFGLGCIYLFLKYSSILVQKIYEKIWEWELVLRVGKFLVKKTKLPPPKRFYPLHAKSVKRNKDKEEWEWEYEEY